MKNKLLNISLSICLLLVCIISLTGCLNYGTVIEFETWGGTNIATKTYEYNTSIDPSTFAKPTKTGYTFSGWYYDDKFENEVVNIMVALNMNVTYYAKYEINEQYFTDTSNYYEWSNDNTSLSVEKDELWTDWYFEVDKTNTSYNFSKITVEPANQSQYICKDIVIYDANGKTMTDKNEKADVFELEEGITSATKFVVKVSTQNAGDLKVVIS